MYDVEAGGRRRTDAWTGDGRTQERYMEFDFLPGTLEVYVDHERVPAEPILLNGGYRLLEPAPEGAAVRAYYTMAVT